MISVLLPSRGRPDSLRRSIASLRQMAAVPDAFEVLVAYDPDDLGTAHAAALADAVAHPAPERFGYARLNEYFNLLAGFASGDWLLLWNDDATVTTPGWDLAIEELPADILVADPQTALSPHLCTFPAVRRAAVEAVGAFSPHTCHCDTFWQDIGRMLGAISPVDMYVHHDRDDITGGHQDQTRAEGRAGYRQVEYYSPAVQTAIAADAEKVRAACL